MSDNEQLPAVRIGQGLGEWIEIEAQLRNTPEHVIVKTATTYPVPYMRAYDPPAAEPELVAGKLTGRQIIIGIVAAIFLLSTYGMGIGSGDDSAFNPSPATVKPAVHDG